MTRPLVRAALLLYPAAWRQRYGAELEELILDCAADHPSFRESARLVIDITASGLAERARSFGIRLRIATIACLCATVGLAVDATALTASDSPAFPITPLGGVSLGPNAILPAGAVLMHAPVWWLPPTAEPQPSRVTVQLLPGTSRVVRISGPPSNTVLNPRTDQIVSITEDG